MLIINIFVKCLTEQSKLGLFPFGPVLDGLTNENV